MTSVTVVLALTNRWLREPTNPDASHASFWHQADTAVDTLAMDSDGPAGHMWRTKCAGLIERADARILDVKFDPADPSQSLPYPFAYCFPCFGQESPYQQAERSKRPDIRNPLLAMPAITELRAMPAECREPLVKVLMAIRSDAQAKAQESWRKNKGPMAAYWKAVGVYAGHIARAIR